MRERRRDAERESREAFSGVRCVRHTVPRWAVLRLGATPNRRSGGTGMTQMIVWNGPMLNSASCHGDMSHYYHESARSMPYHTTHQPVSLMMRGYMNAQAGGPNGSRHRLRAQEMLTAEAIIKKRRNRRERSHTAHGRLVVLFRGTTSMKKSMRQTTQFSIVSSNWGDSFGSEHLPSDI